MMTDKKLLWIALAVFTLVFAGCRKSNRFSVDVTPADSVHIARVDLDLIAFDTLNADAEIEKLFQKYPDFMPQYFSQMLELPATDRKLLADQLRSFCADTVFSKVNADVQAQFADVSDIEAELTNSFASLRHNFPELKLPGLYFFVSGFNRSVVITQAFVGIGTDMYLGSEYSRYSDISYQYMTYNMRRESIAVDVVSAILFSHFPSDVTSDRLLDNMLYRGKLLYVLSAVMPERKPHDIIGYTKFQWEWSRKYESEIWSSILDHNDLYSSDLMLIRKYLNDAPFTAPVSQDSPGRLGAWVGWQIVNAWMDKHGNVSLADLLKENNYQKMLDESGYQP